MVELIDSDGKWIVEEGAQSTIKYLIEPSASYKAKNPGVPKQEPLSLAEVKALPSVTTDERLIRIERLLGLR